MSQGPPIAPGTSVPTPSPERIAPSEVRYIKLGRGGKWVDCSLDGGELHFGFKDAPHETALRADLDVLRTFYVNQGRTQGVASRFAHEIVDFYTQPATTLWITFARKRLWWCFADPKVVWLGDGVGHGARKRRAIDGWRCTDVFGKELRFASLSSWLTKTAAYRATICKVDAREYLVRRLNGNAEPLVVTAEAARRDLRLALEKVIRSLHWRDFELLVDLAFTRLGWRRVSVLGETMADVDIVLEQPATRESGVAQVKSAASQADLDAFWDAVAGAGFARHWFVVHSGADDLVLPDPKVTLWTLPDIADAAMRAGLVDWLLDRCR